MAFVIVDTDVVSFLFKRDSRARPYRRHLLGKDAMISFMVMAELDQWALRRRWGQASSERLTRFLQPYGLLRRPSLVPLMGRGLRPGPSERRAIDGADAWNAAVALAMGAPLLTHNGADYAGVEGLTVISEST